MNRINRGTTRFSESAKCASQIVRREVGNTDQLPAFAHDIADGRDGKGIGECAAVRSDSSKQLHMDMYEKLRVTSTVPVMATGFWSRIIS